MSAQFLHISFNFNSDIDQKALKKKFDKALDWIQYLPNCWIVKTSRGAQKWYERLKPLLGPKDHIFICKLDLSERQGWLPKWIWEWIQKND
ncbi:MAG: hypothetical protein O8C66_09470 [Candidatus Methanoperedens sp.]|nr:hypothetical protein [Candidatus Methanoperedens sp.]MCZ7370724.1 hypothetical protein [Candidatus Methanoperedens sp.]